MLVGCKKENRGDSEDMKKRIAEMGEKRQRWIAIAGDACQVV
jgi:hypothetical protein